MDNFTEIVSQVGSPVGMLAVVVFFLRAAGKFLAPMVEKLFTAHCAMVESLKGHVEQTQPMLRDQHGMIEDIHLVVVPPKLLKGE